MYLIYIKPIYKQIKGNISFEQYGDDHVIIILPFKVTIVQTFANEHIVFLWYMQTLSLVVVFFQRHKHIVYENLQNQIKYGMVPTFI